ncbi:MAG: hypothetical protein LBL19_07850 [Spirochaetaceae bacterium]|jgi:hypothetical protein|nr:hypothetical protein [Spirochaetaceae bacterium]
MKKNLSYGCVLILLSTLFVLTACPPEAEPEPEPEPQPITAPEFSRPSANTEYTLVAYNPANSTATLKKAGETAGTEYTIAETGLKTLFNAIYSPNAPGSTDSIESGKTTTAYSAAISQAALNLFKITLGPGVTTVEIKGTALPTANGASNTQPIVIDVGIPGASNSGLPVFYIPYKGLGDSALGGEEDYSHIRFRVNSGASLVILADNSGYLENSGTGHPCEDGYFKGGTVEVMAGGYLRDGAYEGFPLGGAAVILNRYNSYLAIGPEPGSNDANAFNNYKRYYGGWLLGPGTGPRIVWDTTGNNTWSYLEVRPGVIATDAKLTAKKSLGLIYSVWFVGDAGLTIDAAGETDPVFMSGEQAIHGVFANEFDESSDYNFYGSSSTTIKIKTGNVLDGNFLETDSKGEASPIIATDNEITITGTSTGDPVEYMDSSTEISGILIPAPTA